ncbi:hypothetical protein [Ketobacter alkanivorans]|uniref:Uncharacterized protein n=1 Tax=Ketobacter alkanivorans TaxID=1917421 RepID=A0A2K9LPJ9_9GAMM|nr:hypothetical protein [Ketobacter alkanivorans]AUM14256.1 hypothetical protein Kalk_18310 [Ketobacter alkanivorans]MCP5018810.1 hypothetical protein [Ketobacter sp.]
MTSVTPHIGFPFSPKLQSLSNQFLEAAADSHAKSGEYFYKVILQLTDEVIDYLLVQTAEIAQVNSVGQKVINMCASTSNKASAMLSAKIYKKASTSDMQKVATLWQNMIKNTQPDRSGDWYLAQPIDSSLAKDLDDILSEKGDQAHFSPTDIESIMRRYERLIETIIDGFFLRPAESVKLGAVTRKLLHLGIDGVKQASNAVIHKVVKKLEPQQLGTYVDFTSQFYLRAALN